VERVADEDEPRRCQTISHGLGTDASSHGSSAEQQLAARHRQLPGEATGAAADGIEQHSVTVRPTPPGKTVGEVHTHDTESSG
jgi:hypothetical protein